MAEDIKIYIDKLAKNLQKRNELTKILINFLKIYAMRPRIGVEIEFYLSENIDKEIFANLLKIPLINEKGNGQVEINLAATTNLVKLVKQINIIKNQIINVALELGGNAYLSSKPFINDYGNSMHFHIDFVKKDSDEVAKFNLNIAANSLCHYMLESLLVFMPNSEDYNRIDKIFMAPTHVCHGGNNRTVAVRIPNSLPVRLEYRLASPECNVYLSIYAILKAIYLGFKGKNYIQQTPKIYGNAYDKQYNLKALPTSIEEAKEYFNENFFV